MRHATPFKFGPLESRRLLSGIDVPGMTSTLIEGRVLHLIGTGAGDEVYVTIEAETVDVMTPINVVPPPASVRSSEAFSTRSSSIPLTFLNIEVVAWHDVSNPY